MFTVAFVACAAAAARAQQPAPTPGDQPTSQAPASNPQAETLSTDYNNGLEGQPAAPAQANTLSTVNSNASTAPYTDRLHGPFNAAIELRGNYSNNLFSSSQNQVSGSYFSGGAPVGYIWEGVNNRFSANYRIDGYIYPGYSQINSISQVFLDHYEHKASARTQYFWDGAAGRVTSVGQYLPELIPVGSTGVVQPTVGQNVAQNSYTTSNAVSTVGANHRITETDTVIATITGGWVEQRQQAAAAGSTPEVLRNEPVGGDVQFDHRITTTTTLGLELTDLYLRGLAPAGHDDYGTVEATYKHNFSTYLLLRLAAGPLFSRQTSDQLGSSSTTSYAANAALDYNTRFARIGGNYSRVVQLQYLSTPTIAQQVSAVFDRAVTRNLDVSFDGRFVYAQASPVLPSQTNYGVTARVDHYITGNLSIFVAAARFQRNSAPVAGTPLSYNQNVVSGGVTYLFGPPIERQGPKQQ